MQRPLETQNTSIRRQGCVQKRITLFLSVLLLLSACLRSNSEDTPIVPTINWSPPDLSQIDTTDLPELLVLKVAQEEIGYVEGPRKDETKYGEWFKKTRTAWCAEFITWCVNEADTRYGTSMLRSVYPYYGGTKEGAPFYLKRGRFISDSGKLPTGEKQWLVGSDDYMEADGYLPHPGDLMWIYYYSRKQGPDHVTLVEGISRDEEGKIQIHVIEGNNPDRVQRNIYPIDYKLIYGFGTPVKRAHSDLRVYSTGDDVSRLIDDLIALEYLDPLYQDARDIVDRKMQSAVSQFQKDKSLPVTKIVDLQTREALESALAIMNGSPD